MPILKKVLLCKYWLFIIFLFVIIISFYRTNLDYQSSYGGDEHEFRLTVIDIKHNDNKDIITFSGKEKLISYIDDFSFDVGDIVLVKGNLIKPSDNTIPNLFNYRKYLQSRGIYWKLEAKDISLLKNNSNLLYIIKSYITSRINKLPHNEYVYAFLMGDTSHFNSDVKERYQTLGISYVLVIGSLQIMMLTKFLDKIKVRDKYKVILKILVIIIYILFTNKVIGVLRSGLCYILKSVLKYNKIKFKNYNIILLVGIFLLIVNPYYIANYGFLYSFSISIFISLLNDKITGNYFHRLTRVTIIAFLVSLPITMYSNFEINFLAIIFSLIMIPLFNYYLFPLTIVVFFFPFLSFLFAFSINFIEGFIKMLSTIDILVFIFRKPSMILIIIYYIIIWLVLFNKKYLIILVITLFIHNNVNKIIKEEIITFLDVNEGDSIVLKENNHLVLIDTGGSKNYEYSKDISKYIKSLGISKIDKLFLTHGDLDHLGSSYKLIDKIKVNYVYFNNNELNDNEMKLINKLNKRKIKYQKISKYTYKINDLIFSARSYNLNNENDSSMMMSVIINNSKILLMGDASITSERYLLNDVNLSKYNILKVGHHGSKTSTSRMFYNTVKPDIAIISVGENNIYHLPNYEVINRIKDSKIYQTNTSGSITIKFFNGKYIILECKPYE